MKDSGLEAVVRCKERGLLVNGKKATGPQAPGDVSLKAGASEVIRRTLPPHSRLYGPSSR